MQKISTPDLSDLNPSVPFLGLQFNSYGARDFLYGPIKTVHAPNDNSFVKNDKGELVVSKLNLDFLREISSLSDGKLLRISKSEPISDNILDIINKGEDSLISSFEFSDYEHKFQYPLAVAIVFLMFSQLISSGKRKK